MIILKKKHLNEIKKEIENDKKNCNITNKNEKENLIKLINQNFLNVNEFSLFKNEYSMKIKMIENDYKNICNYLYEDNNQNSIANNIQNLLKQYNILEMNIKNIQIKNKDYDNNINNMKQEIENNKKNIEIYVKKDNIEKNI